MERRHPAMPQAPPSSVRAGLPPPVDGSAELPGMAQAADRKPLFTFVVVADTHVNEDEHTSTSPYETNHLAK